MCGGEDDMRSTCGDFPDNDQVSGIPARGDAPPDSGSDRSEIEVEITRRPNRPGFGLPAHHVLPGRKFSRIGPPANVRPFYHNVVQQKDIMCGEVRK